MTATSSPADAADAVLAEAERGLATITLNRPAALNALTTSMLTSIGAALDAWEHDPAVATVLIVGAGERGLCAGGDLRAMRASALAGDGFARDFFRTEYRVNARIARYGKPIVAVMAGVTMGGGVGLAGHAAIRVVTERSAVAMPEVGIGLVPDVGGTWLLSHAPGETGTYAALTGLTLTAGDAIHLGLADYFVPEERIRAMVDALPGADPWTVVKGHCEPAPESTVARSREWIDACLSADRVPAILERLDAHAAPEAHSCAAVIRQKSPTALAVTLASLRRARALPDLEHVLEQEFRVSCAFLEVPDLAEGIRAQIIDKDRTPRWVPAKASEVSAAQVDAFFSDRGHGSLGLISGQPGAPSQ